MIKFSRQSIKVRLTVAFTALFALTFLLIGVGVWVALSHSINETADRELHSRLVQIRKYFDSFSAEDLKHLQEEFQEEALLSQASAHIRICDDKGKWVFQTPGTERWPAEALDVANLRARGETKTFHIRWQSIRLLTAPVRVGAVQIGLPIDEFEEVKTGFLWLIGLGSPIVLLAAAGGGYWMSGRALRPVDEIARSAARISAQELSARLPGNGSGDELDRLSGVLNGMLERLESAFRRITEFTADASHELRTPIAIIHTTAELMQSRPRTVNEHLQAWRRVAAETGRTSLLIADLLTMARADAGKTEFEFCRIDLAKLVESAVEDMRVLADAKEVRLQLDGGAGPCWIEGDEEALRSVVCILLDNAVKFTSAPGEIRVIVEAGEKVRLMVSDTGVGISEAELPFIFGRFYRVSKDRSRESGGAGLGLAIGRWIVQQHQGEMLVSSRVGEGSIFTVVLSRGD